MSHFYPSCRHRREPRHRGVYHCQSAKLVGLKLVTGEVCAECPFIDHHFPGEEDDSASIHPRMPAESMIDCINGPARAWPPGWADWDVTKEAHRIAADRYVSRLPPYPASDYSGRGIVIAGGGRRYFPSLYITVRAIRHVGCALPIQVWYLGRDDEMPQQYRDLLEPFDVACIDGDEVRREHPCRILNGWELEVFAILHSPFEEVLSLDADCYPVRDPSILFDDPGYRRTGAVFWPDLKDSPFLDWSAFGAQPTGRRSIESGQMLINKRSCWIPLNLAWWYNDHSDFSYLHGYGDKHAIEIAWARCAMDHHRFSEEAPWSVHSFIHWGSDLRPLFVHRCKDKFRFSEQGYLNPQNFAENRYAEHAPLERECFGWLKELRHQFRIALLHPPTTDSELPLVEPSCEPCLRPFVVGIPTLNRYDLLAQCLDSVCASSILPHRVIVVDNGGGFTTSDPRVEIIRPQCNLGVSASWNLIHQLAQPLAVVVINDDICLSPNLLQSLMECPAPMATAFGWACFRQDHEVWEVVGPYDEQFWPAYFEDNDYAYRLKLAAVDRRELSGEGTSHIGSATLAKMNVVDRKQLDHQVSRGRDYYLKKWGGLPGEERFARPFDETLFGDGLRNSELTRRYLHACRTPSDIFEHLPTLHAYASKCRHITEFGIGHGNSTLAFLNAQPDHLISYDVNVLPPIWSMHELVGRTNIRIREESVLASEIEDTELLFIDTLHTCEQLRRELHLHANRVRRFIILHDTVTFGEQGEDGGPGLLFAVEPFLRNGVWRELAHYRNNNGLMILVRIGG